MQGRPSPASTLTPRKPWSPTPAPPPIFRPLPVHHLSQKAHPHTHLLLLPAPALPTKAGAWLLLPYPCLPPLSPLFSLLSLPLPADRVRQVRPVLRAPGPPSTSNQFPPLPRRPPSPSPPGHLFCDFMVAPQPQSLPFICDFLWCGELTPPGVTLVKICAPLRSCSCPVL